MNTYINTVIATAILTIAATTAGAAVKPQSKTIVVASPDNLPVLAQADAEAMYLHDTNDGKTILYIESQHGRQLTALDVTDPARIRRAAKTALPATSAFDFIQAVGEEGALIRYRNGSGVALLNFKSYKHPVLTTSSALDRADHSEALGQTALLVASNEPVMQPIGVDPHNYNVVDISDPAQPGLVASIPTVTQRLSKSDTGTLFLLNRDGVTVVRRLPVEEEHQVQLDQQRGN
jgi:hypothetical protein